MLKVGRYGSKDRNFTVINTTSRSNNWSRGLSPFYSGSVELYGGYKALNVENAWQYSKVYEEDVDKDGNPSDTYWKWAKSGWACFIANRYPKGKGRKPMYSYWDGEKLTYIQARIKIYCPLYSQAVQKKEAFKILKELYDSGKNILLEDFDGYDHKKLGMSYKDVLMSETRKMGHAFVLGMLLENERVWEN